VHPEFHPELDPDGTPAVLQDGRWVLLAPVRAADAGPVQSFVRGLSPQSRRSRFLSALSELPPYMLRRLTQPQPPGEFGLVAWAGPGVVGMAHYAAEGPGRAELGIVVADGWQRGGLGTRLVHHLAHRAAAQGVTEFLAVALAENHAMLALARRLGFRPAGDAEGGMVRLEKPLARGRADARVSIPDWSYA
jgi:acetyltransferase